jgi:hypothetical protein
MPAESLITSLKLMEEPTSFSVKRIARFVNLFCDTVEPRYYFITFTSLKDYSHDASETGSVSRILRAVANILYPPNSIDEMYLSSLFGEKFSFPSFYFAVLREMMTSLLS